MNKLPRVEAKHDFVGKLLQPTLRPRLLDYIVWQQRVRSAKAKGLTVPKMPDWAPLSINLDLTTACNYACTHCIDWDMLNSGVKYDFQELKDSIAFMRARGLRSVILIGGGEPTVHPGFEEMVAYLKDLGLELAIVSNGSRNERILNIMDRLGERDWVRLSLDSGENETFREMHNPKGNAQDITLDKICSWVPQMRERNPTPQVGFSFIIVWKGAEREEDVNIIPNIAEIVRATKRARDFRFSYISLKPFLTRRPGGAEVLDSQAMVDFDRTIADIRRAVDEAKRYETADFRVVESINLKVLETGTWQDFTRQPRMCHKQAFQQVLSPLGLFNCPAHRGVEKARIAGKDSYADVREIHRTQEATAAILEKFDASDECAEVTCLYNSMNWTIEHAVEGKLDPEELDELPERFDHFL